MIDTDFISEVADLLVDATAADANTALLLALGQIAHDNSIAGDMALASIRATLTVQKLNRPTSTVHRGAQPRGDGRDLEAERLTVDQEDGDVAVVPATKAKFKQVKSRKKVSDLREGDKVLGDDGRVLYTCLENSRRPGDGSYNVQVQDVNSEIKRVEWDEDEQNPEIDVLVVSS